MYTGLQKRVGHVSSDLRKLEIRCSRIGFRKPIYFTRSFRSVSPVEKAGTQSILVARRNLGTQMEPVKGELAGAGDVRNYYLS